MPAGCSEQQGGGVSKGWRAAVAGRLQKARNSAAAAAISYVPLPIRVGAQTVRDGKMNIGAVLLTF